MTIRVFVTGTDTDVGKTVVTRAIVRALVNQGRNVAALKPVESGVPVVDGAPLPGDANALLLAAKQPGRLSDICAYTFAAPLSPHLAASLENRCIEPGPIHALLKRSETEAEIVIAEGAGGLLVPLSSSLLYADLIADIGYSLLIVAPNRLGSINGTLLTIEAARSRGIPVLGVILNRTPESDFGNAEAIAKHGDVSVIGCFPDCRNDDEILADAAIRTLDLSVFV